MRVARTADRWGSRPSQLLGIGEPVVAFAVDEALAIRLQLAELEAQDEARRRAQRRKAPDDVLPDGLRFERPEDVD